jgi:hypothetical protein
MFAHVRHVRLSREIRRRISARHLRRTELDGTLRGLFSRRRSPLISRPGADDSAGHQNRIRRPFHNLRAISSYCRISLRALAPPGQHRDNRLAISGRLGSLRGCNCARMRPRKPARCRPGRGRVGRRNAITKHDAGQPHRDRVSAWGADRKCVWRSGRDVRLTWRRAFDASRASNAF